MEDRSIDDSQITASSYVNGHKPHLARLNNQGSNYWAPEVSGLPLNAWIQVDFLTSVELYGIKTQGFRVHTHYAFVSVFEIQTGESDEPLMFIEESGNPKVTNLIQSEILMFFFLYKMLK